MIELDSGRLHVRRAKNGVDSTHPLTGKEIRALRQLWRENLQRRYVFNTERGGPVTRAWFLKMVRRTGEFAKLPFPIHPHMLRHACGFKLANDGVDTRALQHFLGHRNSMHPVRYTEVRSDRFDGFGKDWGSAYRTKPTPRASRRIGRGTLPLAAPERQSGCGAPPSESARPR